MLSHIDYIINGTIRILFYFELVFAIFSLLSYKFLAKNKKIMLFIILIVLLTSIRFIHATSTRYLLPLTILFVPFAAIGYYNLIAVLKWLLIFCKIKISQKLLHLIILSSMIIVCSAKSLRISNKKEYFNYFSQIIQEHNLLNSNTMVLGDGQYASRIAYSNDLKLGSSKNIKGAFSRVVTDTIMEEILKLNNNVSQFVIVSEDQALDDKIKNAQLIANYKDKIFLFYVNFSFDTFKKNQNVKLLFDKVKEIKNYTILDNKVIISDKYIEVDPQKLYLLSGTFVSSGDDKRNIRFGYIPYDKNHKFIHNSSYNYVENSETFLTRACTRNDKVLYISSSEKWLKSGNALVAFDVDKTKKFNDLPNNKLSDLGIMKIKKISDTESKVFLKGESKMTANVNSLVREHYANGNYFCMNSYNEVKNELIIAKSLVGNCPEAVINFPPHTKFFKIFIYVHNVDKNNNMKLDIKEVNLKEYWK